MPPAISAAAGGRRNAATGDMDTLLKAREWLE
jgi:hypothetical protein